ncbi:hypothetical protein F5B19DRAFT_157279 [Rostrohypoxylon terebratum]|nr:hypothetical protein F5B19DRAFT_157279 [Rostrohypoxylon terebratum]
MKSWISAISLAFVLPFAAADCGNIDFTGTHGGDGFTTTYNTTMRVTGWTNCTEEVAAQHNSNSSCPLNNVGVGIGLEVRPDLRYVTVNSRTMRGVLALVQKKANPSSAAVVNFNQTIVMNYTAALSSTSVGKAGYGGFTPYILCFDGVLSGCDKDSQLEGKAIRACGPMWLDKSQSQKSQGEQAYHGEENFVQSDNGANITSALPSYDELSKDASNYQGNGDDSSAMKSVAGSAALVFALMTSAYAIM